MAVAFTRNAGTHTSLNAGREHQSSNSDFMASRGSAQNSFIAAAVGGIGEFEMMDDDLGCGVGSGIEIDAEAHCAVGPDGTGGSVGGLFSVLSLYSGKCRAMKIKTAIRKARRLEGQTPWR